MSNFIDPYTLTRLTAFNNAQSRFAGVHVSLHRGSKISAQAYAQLLFEEM